MTTLSFTRTWPFNRYIANNELGKAICNVAKRQTLKESELAILKLAGFTIKITVDKTKKIAAEIPGQETKIDQAEIQGEKTKIDPAEILGLKPKKFVGKIPNFDD